MSSRSWTSSTSSSALGDLALALHVLRVAHPLLLCVARTLRLAGALGDFRSQPVAWRPPRAALRVLVGPLAVDHEDLPDLLHRVRLQPLADRLQPHVASVALAARRSHLDSFVRLEQAVDS